MPSDNDDGNGNGDSLGLTSDPSRDDGIARDDDSGGNPTHDDDLGDNKKTYFAVMG